jgi:tRNA-splicing ligase RtcB
VSESLELGTWNLELGTWNLKKIKMASKKVKGRDLRKIGYPEGKVIRVIQRLLQTHYKGKSRVFKIDMMKKVFSDQNEFRKDPMWKPVIEELDFKMHKTKKELLLKKESPIKIFGRAQIEEIAVHQMEMAMKLPVAKHGALMPDAHYGYGLPIGGVLAVKNAVIPYAVGLDIACRMSLTVLDMDMKKLNNKPKRFRKALIDNTRFGQQFFDRPNRHDVFDKGEFKEQKLLKELHKLARRQLGTSGSGNHFVEFGLVDLYGDEEHQIPKGKYVAILSHSGSRAFGASIAKHFSKIASLKCKLPKEVRHLAWLSMDDEDGQAYWQAMNLAGDYAKACHDDIHKRLIADVGGKVLLNIENHHNFAWKEMVDGEELIVHRKGATPAQEGVLGIIPGSMTTNGYIVKGKGNVSSIQSASHGAGRKMSRGKAKSNISKDEMKNALQKARVTLVGGGVDEAPYAYKNIEKVIAHQSELIEVLGTFQPKVVRMAGAYKR